MAQAIPPSSTFLLNREEFPTDARNKIFEYLDTGSLPALCRAAGKAGKNAVLLQEETSKVIPTSNPVLVRGYSVSHIQTVLGNTLVTSHPILLPSGKTGLIKLQKITPEEISFEVRFDLLRKAAASNKIELIWSAFDGLKECKNLTPDQKRQLIDFVLRNNLIPISTQKVNSLLRKINALDAASPEQIRALLPLAIQQTQSKKTELLQMLVKHLSVVVDDQGHTRFETTIHPDVLGQALIDLSKNSNSLEGYRIVKKALPATVLDRLSVAQIKNLVTNLSRATPDDLEDLVPLFTSEEVQTELQNLENREAEGVAVAVIRTQNHALFTAFRNAAQLGDSYPTIQRQVRTAIDCRDIYQFTDEYVDLLRTAL